MRDAWEKQTDTFPQDHGADAHEQAGHRGRARSGKSNYSHETRITNGFLFKFIGIAVPGREITVPDLGPSTPMDALRRPLASIRYPPFPSLNVTVVRDALSYRQNRHLVRVREWARGVGQCWALLNSWRMRRHALQMHAMHLKEKAFAAAPKRTSWFGRERVSKRTCLSTCLVDYLRLSSSRPG